MYARMSINGQPIELSLDEMRSIVHALHASELAASSGESDGWAGAPHDEIEFGDLRNLFESTDPDGLSIYAGDHGFTFDSPIEPFDPHDPTF